jgi:hypothetical protein
MTKKKQKLNPLMKMGINETIKAVRQALNGSKKNNKRKGNNVKIGRKVNVPVAKTVVIKQKQPKIVSVANGGILVQHRELVDSSLVANAAFTTEADITINGANSLDWPWLTKIAQNYEFYKFRSLRFDYVPFCSTATAGEIMMGFDYDSADATPPTEQILSSYPGFTSGPVWNQVSAKADPSSMEAFVKWHYVQDGFTAFTPDAQQYNAGSFFLSTANGAGGPVGKLYVEYLVEFKSPTLSSIAPLDISGGQFATTTGITADFPFGSTRSTASGSTGFSVINGNEITFTNPGFYSILCLISGTGLLGTFGLGSLGVGTVASSLASIVNATQTSEWIEIQVSTTVMNGGVIFTSVDNTTITANTVLISENPFKFT